MQLLTDMKRINACSNLSFCNCKFIASLNYLHKFYKQPDKKNKKGNRKFTQRDIEQLELIYYLVKEKGYTLEGAKQHLKQTKPSTEMSTYDLIKRLKHIKSELQDIKSHL